MAYQLLAACNPLWFAGILYFLAVPVMFIGRRVIEGGAYNTSLASNYGDFALVLMIGFGLVLLQQPGAKLPSWLDQTGTQVLLVGITFGIMLLLTTVDHRSEPKQLMDWYHNLFVAPLYVALVILLGGVFLVNGSSGQIFIAYFLVSVWAALLFVDAQGKPNRLNQREWLSVHRPEFFKTLRGR